MRLSLVADCANVSQNMCGRMYVCAWQIFSLAFQNTQMYVRV